MMGAHHYLYVMGQKDARTVIETLQECESALGKESKSGIWRRRVQWVKDHWNVLAFIGVLILIPLWTSWLFKLLEQYKQ